MDVTLSSQIMNKTSSSHIMNGTLPTGITKENRLSDLVLEVVYYLKVLILIVGVFGNSCSVAIWLSKEFRKSARSTICVVLAFANTAFLLLVVGQATGLQFDGFEFFSGSDVSCRVKSVLLGISRQMDSWLILLLTGERFFAVITPYALTSIFDRSKTALYVLIITLAILLFNVAIITHDVSLVNFSIETLTCEYARALILKQLIMAQTPLLFIIPLNTVIVIKVIAQYRRMRHTIAVTQQDIQKRKSLRITASTLSITLSHVILVLPITVVLISCGKKCSKYVDAMAVMPMANAAINFYCYTISSREYRRKLMISLGKLKNHIFTCLASCLQTHNDVAPEVELQNIGQEQFLPHVTN